MSVKDQFVAAFHEAVGECGSATEAIGAALEKVLAENARHNHFHLTGKHSVVIASDLVHVSTERPDINGSPANVVHDNGVLNSQDS
jgi:hypothetical protein